MPLTLPPAPPASLASMAAVLPRLAKSTGLALHAPNMFSMMLSANKPTTPDAPAAFHPAVSVRTYLLGLDAIVDGRGLAGARLALWSHIVSGQADRAAVMADTEATTGQFAQITEGPHAAAIEAAIAGLRADRAVSAKTFDVALLRVPALFVMAVWLQGGTYGDIIVPLDPAPAPLRAGRHYDAQALLAVLKPLAEHALADTDSGKGG